LTGKRIILQNRTKRIAQASLFGTRARLPDGRRRAARFSVAPLTKSFLTTAFIFAVVVSTVAMRMPGPSVWLVLLFSSFQFDCAVLVAKPPVAPLPPRRTGCLTPRCCSS
jgi:hypothetical protein